MTGDDGLVLSILKLLFGQVGVLGTVIMIFAGFLAWLYMQERREHNTTRQLMSEQAEARFKVMEENLRTMSEMNTALNLLLERVSSKRKPVA